MQEKKGFFSFLKGKAAYVDEETKQREYALSKKREEGLTHTKKEVIIEEDEDPTNQEPVSPEIVQFALTYLQELLTLAGFECTIEIIKSANMQLFLELKNTSDQTGRIIGKDGANLFAMQIILNAVIYKKFNASIKITLDAGDYYKKKVESVKLNAKNAAKLVMRNKEKLSLKPMSSSERRLVHMIFKNDEYIRSYSIGDGEYRHVVLEYQKNGTSSAKTN